MAMKEIGSKVIAKDPQGKLSKGEYTGYSFITQLNYVSFYNGYTRGFESLSDINFIEKKGGCMKT